MYSATLTLAAHGLVVVDNHEDNSLMIARPRSVSGTRFSDYENAADQICGLGNTTLEMNAPIATITQRRRPIRWIVDISVPAAPGPGPVYFHEVFASIEDAVNAVIDCYFGDRIDFNNASLRAWKLSPPDDESITENNCG